MSKDIFNTIDLNLLRIFLVVFQEKNTRKAAERLFVTQPAVSQNLKKLRHFFNDELFIKVPEGLQPTPKAEQIAAKITPSLNDLQSSLNELEEFDPLTQKKKVRIAFAPQVMISLSGTFILELKARAPKLEVEIVNWSTTTFSEIENGQLLLGVSYSYSRIPKHIRELELIKLTGCCAVRQEHPLYTTSAKPEAFSDFESASLFIPGWNEDLPIPAKELNAMSLPYKVGFRSAYPMAIVDVLHKTDMFFATSDLFPFDAYPYLRRLDIDSEDIELTYPLNSYFHQRNSNDPLTHWLNQLLIEELEIVRHKPQTA